MLAQTHASSDAVADFGRFFELIRVDISHFRPELLLITTVCLILIADLFMDRKGARSLAALALTGTLGSLLLVFKQILAGGSIGLFGRLGVEGSRGLIDPMLVQDGFALFFQFVFLLGTAVVIGLAAMSKELDDRPMGEFYALLLTALLGCFVMSEANNLLMVFIGIELLSIPSYVLTGWRKKNRASSEAALKYVVYGAVSSGFMLYGFSLFYGMTGSLQLDKLSAVFADGPSPVVPAIAFLLAFAGFAYKLAAVPFHFWAPDVYQGAPTSVTAWLAVTSKAAGVALFARFVLALDLAQSTSIPWTELLALIAAVTMTLGNLSALLQTNLKRMLAYSSVAHVGYILMGVAAFAAPVAGGQTPWSAVSFYVLAYLVMNLGAFACVILANNHFGDDEIKSYAGLGVRAPILALCLAVFLVSLIGLPPTVGFSGKFQLFKVAINSGLIWLAVVAGLNTAISAYYYARVIKVLYFDAGRESPIEIPLHRQGLVVLHLLAVLALGVFFNGLATWTQNLGVFGLQ